MAVLVAVIVGQAVIIVLLTMLVQNQATVLTALWERLQGEQWQTKTQADTGGFRVVQSKNSTAGSGPQEFPLAALKSASTAKR